MDNKGPIRRYIIEMAYRFFQEYQIGILTPELPSQFISVEGYAESVGQAHIELNKLVSEGILWHALNQGNNAHISFNPYKRAEVERLLRQYEKINDVFIIHGHNEILKIEVRDYVKSVLKKNAIVLHEQPNKGKTIIEKLEAYSNVSYAIAIWSADDVGKSIHEKEVRKRTRQNVVFETGYFCSKLGRDKLIILIEEGVEMPSDYSGVVILSFNENWKDRIVTEFI